MENRRSREAQDASRWTYMRYGVDEGEDRQTYSFSQLKRAGLVVEGEYPDVTTIKVQEAGAQVFIDMPVSPEVRKHPGTKQEVTVFHPKHELPF